MMKMQRNVLAATLAAFTLASAGCVSTPAKPAQQQNHQDVTVPAKALGGSYAEVASPFDIRAFYMTSKLHPIDYIAAVHNAMYDAWKDGKFHNLYLTNGKAVTDQQVGAAAATSAAGYNLASTTGASVYGGLLMALDFASMFGHKDYEIYEGPAHHSVYLYRGEKLPVDQTTLAIHKEVEGKLHVFSAKYGYKIKCTYNCDGKLTPKGTIGTAYELDLPLDKGGVPGYENIKKLYASLYVGKAGYWRDDDPEFTKFIWGVSRPVASAQVVLVITDSKDAWKVAPPPGTKGDFALSPKGRKILKTDFFNEPGFVMRGYQAVSGSKTPWEFTVFEGQSFVANHFGHEKPHFWIEQ